MNYDERELAFMQAHIKARPLKQEAENLTTLEEDMVVSAHQHFKAERYEAMLHDLAVAEEAANRVGDLYYEYRKIINERSY